MAKLTAEQSSIQVDARRLLDDLRATLANLPAGADDLALLRQAFTDLDDLFLLVIAGEFNSGKSAFINALAGSEILAEGVTPTTNAVNLVRYSVEPFERWQSDALVERGYPLDWLQNLSIVDTPGTNAVLRRHEEITEEFVPRSDLVLFVTSVDRPFTESERQFLARIRGWGKKVVFVLNKIDLLSTSEDLDHVMAFIIENSQHLLGFSPEVFPVSSKLAQRAKSLPPGQERDEVWARSRFAALERFIYETLDDNERFRLKVASPLGVSQRLINLYLERSEAQARVLLEDVAALETVEKQIELYAADVRHDFQPRLAEVELIIYQMAERGQRFFDDRLRLARAFDLINADRVRADFERTVVADTPRQVEDAVRELSDWLVDRENGLWRMVSEYVERRRANSPAQPVLGEMGRAFERTRSELLASLTRTARESMAGYDKEIESEQLALSVRTALAQTAVAEVGAVGLGAVVAALATTAAVDFTGILAAGVVAGLGLFILPLKKRRAQEEFRQKVDDLRARLAGSTRQEFDRNMSRTLEQVREAVGPYVRFVRSERDRLETRRSELQRFAAEVDRLRRQVETL